MTARIVPIRTDQQRRRLDAERALRAARAVIDAGLSGEITLTQAIHTIGRLLHPVVVDTLKQDLR